MVDIAIEVELAPIALGHRPVHAKRCAQLGGVREGPVVRHVDTSINVTFVIRVE